MCRRCVACLVLLLDSLGSACHVSAASTRHLINDSNDIDEHVHMCMYVYVYMYMYMYMYTALQLMMRLAYAAHVLSAQSSLTGHSTGDCTCAVYAKPVRVSKAYPNSQPVMAMLFVCHRCWNPECIRSINNEASGCKPTRSSCS